MLEEMNMMYPESLKTSISNIRRLPYQSQKIEWIYLGDRKEWCPGFEKEEWCPPCHYCKECGHRSEDNHTHYYKRAHPDRDPLPQPWPKPINPAYTSRGGYYKDIHPTLYKTWADAIIEDPPHEEAQKEG